MSSTLTLGALRLANIARLPDFPTCADWSIADWSNATLGELGEAANIVKKVRRGDFTLDDAREKLAKEMADVLIYLDIYALKCGIDLGDATVAKFNEVSDRQGSQVKL